MAGPVIWSGADGKLIASGTMKDKRNIPYLQQPEKNYISMTGWGDSGGGLTVVETTTASELPREFTSPTGLKIVAGGGISVGDYVYKDFTLDDIDQNRKLNIKWAQKLVSTYAAGDLIVYIANQASRAVPLHTPVVSSIPAYDLDFDANGFDTESVTSLSLVIKNVSLSSGEGIVISDVIVGPGQIQAVLAVGTPVSFTPSWAAGTPDASPASSVATYRRIANYMHLEYELQQDSAGSDSAVNELTIPGGLTIDGSIVGIGSGGGRSILEGAFHVSTGTGALTTFYPKAYTSTTLSFLQSGTTTSFGSSSTPNLATTTLRMRLNVAIPIAEWAGAPNYAGQNDVEYAYNSSTSTSTETTAFAYGPSGVNFYAYAPAGTTAVTKRVRFPTAIQVTDRVWLEVLAGGNTTSGAGWMPVGANFFGYIENDAGTTSYGMILNTVSGSTTDMDVNFYSRASPSTTWASIGSVANYKWRVVKAKAGAAVGFGAAAQDRLGLVKAGQVPGTNTNDEAVAGYVGEYLEQQRAAASATALTTATPANVTATALTLTAGDWDLEAVVGYTGTATAPSYLTCGISNASATLPSGTAQDRRASITGQNVNTADTIMHISRLRISTSTTATYYLVAQAAFASGTVSVYGRISARRAR